MLLVCIDLLAAAAGGLLAFVVRFGDPSSNYGARLDLLIGLLLPIAWVVMITANGAYERRFVGVGSAEFQRVFRSFLHVTVALVLVFYAVDAPVARGFMFPAVALTLFFDLMGRYAARKWLHSRRRRGLAMTSVIAIGGPGSVAAFAALLRHDRHAGMRVVGACLPSDTIRGGDGERDLEAIGVPVVGDIDSIRSLAAQYSAETVAVLSGEIGPDKLRWISWQLEGSDVSLVVSPGLAEVGGRRLHIQPVAGLPLLHIEEPAFGGFRRMVKGAFDRILAGLALLVLAPVLLTIAALVRVTSVGPALFTQTRVGRGGRTFRILKFRSMFADAEDGREDLAAENESAGPLFKIREDPRVTRLGRMLRRYSLDELPQLVNVLTGSMSLVGPRPPLPSEVENYHEDVRRRLLVKPGLTGLWQISGRSDLSWEDSVRLDLRYVENWSLSLDLVVLWKTVRAVMRADGAY